MGWFGGLGCSLGRASLDCGDVGISDWFLRGFGVLWRFRCLGVDFAYFCGLGVAVSSCGLDCFRVVICLPVCGLCVVIRYLGGLHLGWSLSFRACVFNGFEFSDAFGFRFVAARLLGLILFCVGLVHLWFAHLWFVWGCCRLLAR